MTTLDPAYPNPNPCDYGITDELIQRAATAVNIHPIDAQLVTAAVAPVIRQQVAEQIAAAIQDEGNWRFVEGEGRARYDSARIAREIGAHR